MLSVVGFPLTLFRSTFLPACGFTIPLGAVVLDLS